MAKKNDNQKVEATAPEPKDQRTSIYEAHQKGVTPADNAEQHGIDSREVLAIIQEVQASKRK